MGAEKQRLSAPQVGPITLSLLGTRLHLHNPDPWIYLIGALVSGIAYAGLAVICGFRARSPRTAVVHAYLINVAFSYLGMVLSLASPAIGEWARMPALTFALWVEPEALAAPGWMVGGALYTIDSEFVQKWIVWITVGVFMGLAGLLCALSLGVVRRARRPQR